MGERAKTANALQRLLEGEYVVLGTVSDSTTPTDEILLYLAGRPWSLWPDADASGGGQRHVREMGGRIDDLEIELRWIDWPGAPDKGDAAEFVAAHSRDALLALLEAAVPWAPEAESARSCIPRVPR